MGKGGRLKRTAHSHRCSGAAHRFALQAISSGVRDAGTIYVGRKVPAGVDRVRRKSEFGCLLSYWFTGADEIFTRPVSRQVGIARLKVPRFWPRQEGCCETGWKDPTGGRRWMRVPGSSHTVCDIHLLSPDNKRSHWPGCRDLVYVPAGIPAPRPPWTLAGLPKHWCASGWSSRKACN